MQAAVHFWVTGRVQGVYFRAHTKAKAEELGLTGWVRNLSNGRVEGLACGDKSSLDALTQWLANGPERAQVSHLELQPEQWAQWPGFEIV